MRVLAGGAYAGLSARQRRLLALLAVLAPILVASGAALIGGRSVATNAIQAVLVTHAVAGIAGSIALVAFVVSHLRRPPSARRGTVRLAGFGTAAMAALVIASGAVRWSATHLASSILLIALFLLHRRLSSTPIRIAPAAASSLLLALLLIGADAIERNTSRDAQEVKTFFPSLMQVRGPVDLASPECANCHPDIAAQWSVSAHRFSSFNNPFYRHSIRHTRKTRGNEASQWCGGCHDPAVLTTSGMLGEIDEESAAAQAGLTCRACHAIEEVPHALGNADYVLRSTTDYWRPDLILSMPEPHKREMLKPVHRTSELCSACHKVSIDVPVNGYRWIRGQNEYDAWHNSGVAGNNPATFHAPPQTKICRDCHMPLEPAVLGDAAAKSGMVRSHRFIAANTALPHLRGDRDTIERTETFLSDGKLRLDLFAPLDQGPIDPGDTIEIHAVVRNLGVGHAFPGGTIDSNESWIELIVELDGEPLCANGLLRDHEVDPSAHFFRALLVDRHGERIDMRNAADIYTAVYANVIPPSGSDVARYRIAIPPDASGDLRIRARLLWRKFDRRFTEIVFAGEEIPELPITAIAEDSARIPLGSPLTPDPLTWDRLDDYGIALLLDGDLRAAISAFEALGSIAPERPDPWLNLARAHLLEGDLARARTELEKARALGGRTALFEGQLEEREGNLDRAIDRYREALAAHPNSRDLWKHVGRAELRRGNHSGSIEAYARALAIDPEDAAAHHGQAQAYELAGRSEDARASREAFAKYKIDERAPTVTQRYRREHPEAQAMSERIAVHACR